MTRFKKVSKLLMSLLLILISIVTYSAPVFAQDVVITTAKTGVIQRGNYYAETTDGKKITHSDGYDTNWLYVNGVPSFCIEPHILVGNGDGYTISDFNHAEREMFSRIIYHGFDNTNKTAKDYVITQNVLWEFIESIRDDLYIHKDWTLEGIDYLAEKASIMSKVNAHHQLASFADDTIAINAGEEITLTDLNNIINNSAIISDGGLDVSIQQNKLIIKTSNNSPTSTTITFKKYPHIAADTAVSPILYSHPTKQKVINSGNPDPMPFKLHINVNHEGTLKIGKINQETNQMVANTTFELSSNSNMSNPTTYTTQTDGFTSNLTLEKGRYYYREVSVPSPLIIDQTIRSVDIVAGQSVEVVASNEVAKGQITLEKRDQENNQVLANASYIIYKDESLTEAVETITTDANGKATSSILDLGQYYIKESIPPVGYLSDETIYPIHLQYQDQFTSIVISSLSVRDQVIKGKIQIVKVEEDQTTPIEGATFSVKDNQDNLVGTLITDVNGFALTSDLRYGQYFIQEQSAPFQFAIDKTIHPISIFEDGVTVVKYIANKKIEIRLKIEKYDNETQLPLKGAVFEITDLEGNVISFDYINDDQEVVVQNQITTNQDGIAYTRGFLKAGTYYLKEIEAPDGYLKMVPIQFEINQDTEFVNLPVLGYTTTLSLSNVPTTIEILKISENTNEPLAGVHLRLSHEASEEIIAEWISEEEPILFKGLNINDTYILEEIEPLNGYFKSDPIIFKVKETHQIQSIVLSNELIPEIKTNAFFIDQSKLSKSEYILEVVDEVTYTDLIVGIQYKLKGQIIDKQRLKVLAESEIEFIPEEEHGSIQLVFELNGSQLHDQQLVVFERLYRDDVLKASHEDINDKAQTLYIPEIKTKVGSITFNDEEPHLLTLVDTVMYSNLLAMENYTLIGNIIDKQTNELLSFDDKTITSITQFKPENEVGEVDVSFNFDASQLEKGAYVVFEELYHNEKLIAEHKDINDTSQTFIFIDLIISKKDADTDEAIEFVEFELYNNKLKLIDTLITDKDGLARITLLPGEYIIREVKSHEDYLPYQKDIEVELTGEENEFQLLVEVLNQKIPEIPDIPEMSDNLKTYALAFILLVIGLLISLVAPYFPKKDKRNEE